jgi:hypothetical protein
MPVRCLYSQVQSGLVVSAGSGEADPADYALRQSKVKCMIFFNSLDSGVGFARPRWDKNYYLFS